MKAYALFPALDPPNPEDPAAKECVALIASMVCESLRAGGDHSHATVDWRDPDGEPWSSCTEGRANAHIVLLPNQHDLEKLVRMSVDPYSGHGAGIIRSIATCRAATFGYDGQAFLCLRHEDDAPVSPRPELVIVEERADLLRDWDVFDGYIVSRVSNIE